MATVDVIVTGRIKIRPRKLVPTNDVPVFHVEIVNSIEDYLKYS